jgi:hypothetical protein
MMMHHDTEKQLIRTLIQMDEAPGLHPDFQEKLTHAWLGKSMTTKLVNHQFGDIRIFAFLSQRWWWSMPLLLTLTLGAWFWQHQHEIEDFRQFDVLLEFSMGTL